MANRETKVSLTIDAGVTGRENVAGLAGDLRTVGAAAVESTPELDRLAAELTKLQATTTEQREQEKAARAEAAATKDALNQKRDALALLRAESDRATRSTSEFQAKETALKVSIVETRSALRDKQAAVTAAAESARIAAAAEQALQSRIEATGAAAVRAAAQQVAGNAAVSDSLAGIKTQYEAIRNLVLAAAGGSFLADQIKTISETADAYNNLQARVKIATDGGKDFDATFKGIYETAQRTGVAVEDLGALTTRLIQAGKEMQLTSADALRLAESVAQATQLSGASAQEAASAVTQFSQAIASGRLQGDELKSLLETSPRLARALADGLGVATGQLKELGAAGSLTSQQVVAALQGQSAALQREFDQLPLTLGRAITNLGTSWQQYVGEADQATGATRTAAEAVQALARNLETVGSVLFGAGKAAAAYAAVKLAAAFFESAAAASAVSVATRAATVATVANTEATVANAVAQRAAAAAGAESVGMFGRLVALVPQLKLAALVGVAVNFRDIGTAIGEGVAKLMGYGKGLQDLENAAKADEAATRANSAAKAEFAQRLAQASDKALGLTKESRALVAEFDGLVLKGESAADALGKVSKSLNLSDVKGITDAGTALDALAQRGKITADQLRETLGAALKGLDLGVFEAQARAAFDGSEQGARRLKAALDAITDESLKRAGSSLQELETGFSKAANAALNDLDAVARGLTDLSLKGDDAGRVLGKAIDQALAAATTERAVQAVIDRVQALGEAGALTGDALARALDKARAKADDLKAGVNSLDEALRAFGLKTQTELTATADLLGQAYGRISNAAGISLQTQIEAFTKWRDAAVAAGQRVEGSQIEVARRILEIRAEAAGMGDALVRAMDRATGAARTARDAIQSVATAAAGISDSGLAARNAAVPSGPAAGSFGQQFQQTARGGITRTVAGAQAVPPDNSGDWVATTDPRLIQSYAQDAAGRPIAGVGWYLPREAQIRRGQAMEAGARWTAPSATDDAGNMAPGGYMARTVGQVIEIQFRRQDGTTSSAYANNQTDADAIVATLQEAFKRAGG